MVQRSAELHLCPDSPRSGQLWGAEQLHSANPNRQTLWTQVFCCCWTANHMSKVSSHPESGHSTQECSITLDYTVCFFAPLAGCGQLAFRKCVVKYSEKGHSRLFQLRCKFVERWARLLMITCVCWNTNNPARANTCDKFLVQLNGEYHEPIQHLCKPFHNYSAIKVLMTLDQMKGLCQHASAKC